MMLNSVVGSRAFIIRLHVLYSSITERGWIPLLVINIVSDLLLLSTINQAQQHVTEISNDNMTNQKSSTQRTYT